MRFLFFAFLFLAFSCTYVPPYPSGPQQQWSQGGPPAQNFNPQPPPQAQTNNQAPNPAQGQIEYPDASNTQASTRGVPLPYDLIPDLLTAFTCPNPVNSIYPLSLSSYFYGLQLSEEFKEHYNIPERISREDSQRIRQDIEQNPRRGATAELSLRWSSNVTAKPVKFGEQSPYIKRDFAPLDIDSIKDQLSTTGTALSTRPIRRNQYNSDPFRSFLTTDRSIFLNSILPELEQGVGNYLLALTYYLHAGNPPQPIAVQGTQIYGKTYKLRFNNARAGDYLTDVFEEDLTYDEAGEEWTCPDKLRFIVHRTKDPKEGFNKDAFIVGKYGGPENQNFQNNNLSTKLIPEGYCDTDPNNPPFSSNSKEMIFLKTRFGTDPDSHWPFKLGRSMAFTSNSEGIDTGRGGEEAIQSGQFRWTGEACIVPLNESSCYGTQPPIPFRVEFHPSKRGNCERRRRGRSPDFKTADDPIYRVCPAFLSMCYRRPE